jgi:demethylmenaquinone methyltransferase/2-methoxy-6-polyprenyl-1,4-benzoquinol methylase
MSNLKPYSGEESKTEQVQNMFDRVARRYDLLNHLLSMGADIHWRNLTVKQATANKPQKIVDLACGTADLTIALARKALDAELSGYDLSEGMLEVGRRKVRAAGLDGRITLEQGNGEALPVETESADSVTIAFGIRNFEHPELGLKEMTRILKPNGRLVILEFSMPSNSLFRALYKWYFKNILPTVAGWISGDRKAYEYLPKSVELFPSGQKFADMMIEQGCKTVTIKSLMGGIAMIYTGIK